MPPAARPFARQRLLPLTVTALLHLLLVLLWLQARTPPAADFTARGASILWLLAEPPPPLPSAPRTLPPPAPKMVLRQAPAVVVPAPVVVVEAAAATAPSAPTTAEILEQAKRNIGQFDQTLSKERGDKLIHAPRPLTKQERLAQGIEEANAAAPNKWYQAPKVTEIVDPGGYGRRRYRVVGALGTYCITVESNHAPDGLDTMKNGSQQKRTTCDEKEQSLTHQKW